VGRVTIVRAIDTSDSLGRMPLGAAELPLPHFASPLYRHIGLALIIFGTLPLPRSYRGMRPGPKGVHEVAMWKVVQDYPDIGTSL
jgi:hypothetical protein